MDLSEAAITRHRITVHEYYRMAETGILAPDARVELIEGEIIDMAPIGSNHSSVVDRTARMLFAALHDLAIIRVQGPVRLDDRSEPEPDLALLKPRADFYRDRHPGPADVFLVIEVSDTTLAYDRGVKVPLYAKHGIAEAWLIDLNGNLIHVYRNPGNGEYTDLQSLVRPGWLSIQAFPDMPIEVSGIF